MIELQKITEPREEFIYKKNGNENNLSVYPNIDYTDPLAYKLIGKLGITHKIVGNKLVEIPRRDIEVGDVFESYREIKSICLCNTKFYVLSSLTGEENEEYITKEDVFRYYKKVGILGIHYELKNTGV